MKEAQDVTHSGRVMRHELTTSASLARVWSAWTEPERLSEWLTDRAEGRVEPGLEYTWIWDWCDMLVPYRVVLVEAERRLVLESDLRHAPGPVLEVTLSTRAGRTVVNLVASGFGETADWDDEYAGTDAGWHAMLAVLREYVENHFGQPRSTFTATRTVRVIDETRMRDLFTGADMSRWLVERGSVGDEGTTFALTLRDGGTFTGEVLAVASREIQVTWQEIDGVIGFMVAAGPSASERLLCINGGGWRLSPARAGALGGQLGRSLGRLAALL